MYRVNFKDWLYQGWLYLNCMSRYHSGTFKVKPFPIPENYSLTWQSDFNSILAVMEDFDIGPGHYIGDVFVPYHPDFPDHYYAPKAWSVFKGHLSGHAWIEPKEFNGVTVPNATPMAVSRAAYKYGIFKFSAKMPFGKFLWPAIWFTGDKLWPPEIDLVEAFPRDTYDFDGGKGLSSNVHVRVKDKPEQVKSVKHPIYNPQTMHDYILWWTKDFIKIYYDGHLVRKITTKRILEKVDVDSLKIIIGTGTSAEFFQMINPMEIWDIKVYQ